MKYSSSQATRQGGRELNEDRCVHSHTQEACLFAVADGMGGHPEGEVAAQIAVDTFSNLFGKQARPSLSDPMQFLADALLQAHQQILRYAIQKKLKDSPRTTLVPRWRKTARRTGFIAAIRACTSHAADTL